MVGSIQGGVNLQAQQLQSKLKEQSSQDLKEQLNQFQNDIRVQAQELQNIDGSTSRIAEAAEILNATREPLQANAVNTEATNAALGANAPRGSVVDVVA